MKDHELSVNEDTANPERRLNKHLLSQGTENLRNFFTTMDTLRAEIKAWSKDVDPSISRQLIALNRKIDSFEASVTLFGQVKAGKTSLTNVLSGNVALLPSDINPWTSVVTSVHMNARNANTKIRAAFKFFEDSEWDTMIKGGGRLGELADRAGADEDLERLRTQIEEMRETARQRLSGKFEALLGKTHRYGYVDAELMERYVCLGDPEEILDNPESQQGRFSDLVKSADIWLDVPQLGGSLLVRDTPGVNDTFLVREQITIQALRQSKVCVVVLSAHEALNTTDLALLRLISNYEKRQIVIFVNRIDELLRPSEQVPEIQKSIRMTLKSYQSLKDVSVLFGSALWAEMALTGDYSGLDEEATAAIDDWSENCGVEHEPDRDSFVWKLSGIPALMQTVNDCIIETDGYRHLKEIEVTLKNIAGEIAAKEALSRNAKVAEKMVGIDVPALRKVLADITKSATEALEVELAQFRDRRLLPALGEVKFNHVERARSAILEHLRQKPSDEAWEFDAKSLRTDLRSKYDKFAGDAHKNVQAIYLAAADALKVPLTWPHSGPA